MIKGKLLTIIFLVVFCLGSLSYGFPHPGEVTELIEILTQKTDSALEVSIHVRGEFGNDMFKLADPERLVLDLSPIDTISANESIDLNAFGVLRVRVGQFKTQVARLVFDLESPAVNYKIEKNADGLKISFWKGEPNSARLEENIEIKPEEKAETKAGEKPLVVEEKPPVEVIRESPREAHFEMIEPTGSDSQKGYFVHIGGGGATFIKSPATFFRTFSFYDKLTRSAEDYVLKLNTPLLLSFGKYFYFQGIPVKAGLGFEYWDFKTEGQFNLAVASPLISGSIRTIARNHTSRVKFTSVSLYGLFRIFKTNKLVLWAGPEIGYSFGKLLFLNSISIDDNPPYADDDITITSISYERKTVSGLRAGLQTSFEYILSRKMALILNLKAVYLRPEIKDRSSLIDLSQAQFLLGLQYHF